MHVQQFTKKQRNRESTYSNEKMSPNDAIVSSVSAFLRIVAREKHRQQNRGH